VKGGMKKILKSYFYWTYARGSFHYDVLVTLILLFVFITPHLWNYGDTASSAIGIQHPIQVVGNERGFIVTVAAADVALDLHTTASKAQIKKALRKAVEPVTGDAVFVDDWQTVVGADGQPAWRVWAHR
jgi:hypothetical protein